MAHRLLNLPSSKKIGSGARRSPRAWKLRGLYPPGVPVLTRDRGGEFRKLDVLTRTVLHPRPSHPRFFASSVPRVLHSSRPLFLASSHPRVLYSSHPLFLAPPFPRILHSSYPQFLVPSIRSSHSLFFASPKGRILRSSHPQSPASFLPQGFVLERICYCNPQGVALRTLPLLCNL